MAIRPFLLLVGVIFGIIAVLHLFRIIAGWPAVMGGAAIPMWVSWLGLVVTGFLSVQAFRHANRLR
jgi:uncharacterized membrane protein